MAPVGGLAAPGAGPAGRRRSRWFRLRVPLTGAGGWP